MKTFIAAAALMLASVATAAPAAAQIAAGTVPNTFDRPARAAAAPAAVAPASTRAPVQPATVAPPASATPGVPVSPANAASEDTLRALIAGAQAGTMDYALMTDDLATKMRQQQATITPLLQGFGAVQVVDFMTSQNGNDLFAVTFANAATEWLIGFNETGKVAALLFRPAQ